MSCIKSCTFPENPWVNKRPLTKSRHLTCVAGNYLSLGPSGRRRGNYSSELSGQSELPFGRRQTVQRAGGLPRRSSPGPAGPLTCRRRKIGAHDALPSRRRFCVFWESAVFPSTASNGPSVATFDDIPGLKCRPHPPHEAVLYATAVAAPRNPRSPKGLPVREPSGSMWHDPQQLQHVHPEALGSPAGYVVPTGHADYGLIRASESLPAT